MAGCALLERGAWFLLGAACALAVALWVWLAGARQGIEAQEPQALDAPPPTRLGLPALEDARRSGPITPSERRRRLTSVA